jgi:hypothetical protein
MVISKSVHKRGWSTRKLASNLTIRGPQCSKRTVHRNQGSILEPIHARGLFYAKSLKIRRQNTDRSGQFEDLRKIILTHECPVYLSVPGTHKNDCVWAKNTPKVEPIQTSKLFLKIMVWGAMTASGVSIVQATCVPPNQTLRAKNSQETILSLFLPDDMNKAGDTAWNSYRKEIL